MLQCIPSLVPARTGFIFCSSREGSWLVLRGYSIPPVVIARGGEKKTCFRGVEKTVGEAVQYCLLLGGLST